jgi:catechol 2,3-dioxygenase-like lactoylglutathione lyase family enzyme
MAFLNTPGSRDTITLNEDAEKAEQAGTDAGVAHFGFRREPDSDLEAAISDVEAGGGKLLERGEHQPGVPFAYVQDPDGYVIEL